MNKLLLTTAGRDIIRKLCLVLSALVILWCPLTTSAQVDFPSIDAFLKSNLKGEGQLSLEARGDLNGDGLEDWAGVTERKKSDSLQTAQLYVLLQQRQGGYRVAEKSKEESISPSGCCLIENLEIRHSSIYVQHNEKSGDTMEAAFHQFKLYKGEWRLSGVRIYNLNVSANVSIETDMNLLTGVVVKRQKGENRPTIKKRRQRFAAYLLKDYDFSNEFGTR